MQETQAESGPEGRACVADCVLAASDVVVREGQTQLVAGVSVQVCAGERVALIGESGSGKSLLCRAMTGLLPDTLTAQGTVRLGGDHVMPGPRHGWARHWGTTVGWVGQDSRAALNPLVKVGSQVREPLRRLGWSRSAAQARAVELLESLGFADPVGIMRRHPGELSGGQRQRAVIALAVAASPQLVVADEPTSALDPVAQQTVLQALTAGIGEAALLLVTHDLAVAASLCDRLVVMRQGRVVADGPTAQVLSRSTNDHVQALIQATHTLSTGRAGTSRVAQQTVPL